VYVFKIYTVLLQKRAVIDRKDSSYNLHGLLSRIRIIWCFEYLQFIFLQLFAYFILIQYFTKAPIH
jgi:hypothetical protein